jgi:hypothetical protein
MTPHCFTKALKTEIAVYAVVRIPDEDVWLPEEEEKPPTNELRSSLPPRTPGF